MAESEPSSLESSPTLTYSEDYQSILIGQKRKQSAEDNDSGDSTRVKKARVNLYASESVENGVKSGNESGEDLPWAEDEENGQDSPHVNNLQDRASGDEASNETKQLLKGELSPSFDASYDYPDSPESPDWLSEGYFERKLNEPSQPLVAESPTSIVQILNTHKDVTDLESSGDTIDYNDPSENTGCGRAAKHHDSDNTQHLTDSPGAIGYEKGAEHQDTVINTLINTEDSTDSPGTIGYKNEEQHHGSDNTLDLNDGPSGTTGYDKEEPHDSSDNTLDLNDGPSGTTRYDKEEPHDGSDNTLDLNDGPLGTTGYDNEESHDGSDNTLDLNDGPSGTTGYDNEEPHDGSDNTLDLNDGPLGTTGYENEGQHHAAYDPSDETVFKKNPELQKEDESGMVTRASPREDAEHKDQYTNASPGDPAHENTAQQYDRDNSLMDNHTSPENNNNNNKDPAKISDLTVSSVIAGYDKKGENEINHLVINDKSTNEEANDRSQYRTLDPTDSPDGLVDWHPQRSSVIKSSTTASHKERTIVTVLDHSSLKEQSAQDCVIVSSSTGLVKRASSSNRKSPSNSKGNTSSASDVIIIEDIDPVISGTSSHSKSDLPTVIPTFSSSDSIKKDADTITSIVGGTNVTLLYRRLEQKKLDPNRVSTVLNEVLEGQLQAAVEKEELTRETSAGTEDDSIFIDVGKVVKQLPNENPNEVFMLLEANSGRPDRINFVVQLLKGRGAPVTVIAEIPHPPSTSVNNNAVPITQPPLSKSDSDPNDPLLAGDPLYAEMRTIARVFPSRDRNEIYAFLEAHHDKSNRVQIVMDELLERDSQTLSTPAEDIVILDDHIIDTPIVEVSASDTTPVITSNAPGTSTQTQLDKEIDQLKNVFPDCDPNYIYNRLEQSAADPQRAQKLASQMFETRNYPKLKDVLEKETKLARKKKLTDLNFNMEEFLTMFPDPSDTFYKEDKPVSENYKNHSLAQLQNYFPILKACFVKKIFQKHKSHFTPTLRELEKEAGKFKGQKKSPKFMHQPRQYELPFPEEPDELFFKELLFTKHEQELKDHVEEVKRVKTLKIEKARTLGELMECACCYDDECMFEDMAACADGHLFCKECVRRSAEVVIGQSKFEFPCMSEGCEHKFPLQTLQTVLPSSVFSNVLRRLQEEEIKQADIPDLVSCPFCSFATIMPDPNDKVFKCLNPECLKESCRLCHEPNHVPLRCEEVEKGGETSMRTFIENKITEAMLRTCYKCSKNFYKIEGCNKMTCTCGATMCYVCRAPNIDYGHFNENTGCAAFTDMNELHRQEMEKAAKEAKEKFKQENPDAAELELKNDPMKIIEDMKKERERQQANQAGVPFGAQLHGHIPGIMMPQVFGMGHVRFGMGNPLGGGFGGFDGRIYHNDNDNGEGSSEEEEGWERSSDEVESNSYEEEDEEEEEDGYYNYY